MFICVCIASNAESNELTVLTGVSLLASVKDGGAFFLGKIPALYTGVVNEQQQVPTKQMKMGQEAAAEPLTPSSPSPLLSSAVGSPAPPLHSSPRVHQAMEGGRTAYHNLRGPSPIVWAMRTRVAPPPPLTAPVPLPVYPPPPPPLPPLPERRHRGRPRNCDRLTPPGFAPSPPARAQPRSTLAAHGQGELGGLQPHVLTIAAGEDIISRVMVVSQTSAKAICVLSALGAVKEAILLQPSGAILNHQGPLEIIRLSGSILTSNDHGCLRVTLASVNSSVISGIIAGPLIAATSVQVILGSFHSGTQWPHSTPRAVAGCPNSEVTIDNGSTLSCESFNPEYASCTSVEQNGSSEIDVKPSLEMLTKHYYR